MKFRLFILLMLISLSVEAQIPGLHRSEFHRRPVEWYPADTLRDSLPEAFASVDAHLRVRIESHHKLDISLIFNRRDSLNFSRCRLSRDAGPVDDRIVAAPVYLTVSEALHGAEHTLSCEKISSGLNPRSDDFSLKLIVCGGNAVIATGQDGEVLRLPLRFEPEHNTELQWVCGSPAGLVRHNFSAEAIAAPRYCRFADVQHLTDYLNTSSDPNEGCWVYFDRDTDPLRLNVSAGYRLATLRAADGNGYEIVYLSGAEHVPQWSPMRIKGYLRPTGFIGHFDLEWIDLEGRTLKRETSADITDGSSLTLYFPLYKSKVRFRKATGSETLRP